MYGYQDHEPIMMHGHLVPERPDGTNAILDSVENIPVKWNGHEIGRAMLKGEKLVIDIHETFIAQGFFNTLRDGMCEGFSIAPILIPAVPAYDDERDPDGLRSQF